MTHMQASQIAYDVARTLRESDPDWYRNVRFRLYPEENTFEFVIECVAEDKDSASGKKREEFVITFKCEGTATNLFPIFWCVGPDRWIWRKGSVGWASELKQIALILAKTNPFDEKFLFDANIKACEMESARAAHDRVIDIPGGES